MSEPECRHLPRPVWNSARCSKCGATIEEPANARLIQVAKRVDAEFIEQGDVGAADFADLHDALAEAGRGGLTWTSERPTVPGWYWILGFEDKQGLVMWLNDWDLPNMALVGCQFAGPIPAPTDTA